MIRVATWPTGLIRFDGEIFEHICGEMFGVPVTDIVKLKVTEKAGRLELALSYRAGLENGTKSFWVDKSNAAALQALATAVARP
jgi:hypothetical protein